MLVAEINPMFEPEKEGYTTVQIEALYTKNPTQLAKWDDYRKADWSELIDCPDIVLEQTNQLLSI